MELELGRRIEEIRKLEFVAEDYYQTNIMGLFTYLFCTWSLPAKCAKITSLFTTYEIIGRIRPFTPFRFIILFHSVCYPNWDFRYYSYSNCYFRHFELFRFIIFAILVIQNYYFPPSLLFNFPNLSKLKFDWLKPF